MRHNAPVQPLVFRSTVARVVAWIFVAFAALNLIDVIVRGRGQSGRITFAVLVAMARVVDQLLLRELEALRLALARLDQRLKRRVRLLSVFGPIGGHRVAGSSRESVG